MREKRNRLFLFFRHSQGNGARRTDRATDVAPFGCREKGEHFHLENREQKP